MVTRGNEIECDQKGTREQHLSVLDYKKKVREQAEKERDVMEKKAEAGPFESAKFY